jgi:hypothetical protein
MAMNTNCSLVDRDGWVFVREIDDAYDKPVRTISYWPIGLKTYYLKVNYGEHKLGQSMRYQGQGVYLDEDGLRYELKNNGETKAEHWEEEQIVCPKVRKGIETRFHRGSWQKYLKSQGWVNA